MKKHFVLAAAVALSLGVSLLALPSAEASITTKALKSVPRIEVQNAVPVKIIADYRKEGYSGLLDLGTLTDLDDARDFAVMNKLLDAGAVSNMPKVDCSCVLKKLTIDGKQVVVMGRNMDLPTSNYPAFIFRTEQPGKYKTINIGYGNTGIESFEQIAETSTMDNRMFTTIPYMATDVMNEKGLVMEINMRSTTPAKRATGTNPGKLRICELQVMRYFGDHCASIAEALEALKGLDVYTANSSKLTTWHLAIAMSDATGRYGVLEFVGNKPVWHESYPGQTNFWIDAEARKICPFNIGYGRWAKAMQMYSHVQTPADMQKVMATIHYKPLCYDDAQNVAYDVATEMTDVAVANEVALIKDWIQDYGIKVPQEDMAFMEKLAEEQKDMVWTTEWVMNQDNQATVYRFADIISACMRQLPASAHRLSGKREISAISYVANPIEKVYHVRFFETGKTYDFGFDSLKAH